MYTYKAMRYHALVEDQFVTLEEAIKRACSDDETDQAYPTQITDASGKTVFDRAAIEQIIQRHDRLKRLSETAKSNTLAAGVLLAVDKLLLDT